MALSSVARLVAACVVTVCAGSALRAAVVHPHGADSEVYFSGTIKRVDPDARTLVLDAVDPRSLSRRDVVASVDRDATIRRGKQMVALADLEPGTRATCAGFLERDQGDRIVLTDVRTSEKRR